MPAILVLQQPHSRVPRGHLPCKVGKRRSILIHDLVQIRLRKHRQRIPRHPPRRPLADAAHKVRHRGEPAARDPLQRLAGLERERVARDAHLCHGARAGVDVEPGARVWGGGELAEGGCDVHGEGDGGLAEFVDKHCACEAGQAAVVDVRCTPVVFGFGVGFVGGLGCWRCSGVVVAIGEVV